MGLLATHHITTKEGEILILHVEENLRFLERKIELLQEHQQTLEKKVRAAANELYSVSAELYQTQEKYSELTGEPMEVDYE